MARSGAGSRRASPAWTVRRSRWRPWPKADLPCRQAWLTLAFPVPRITALSCPPPRRLFALTVPRGSAPPDLVAGVATPVVAVLVALGVRQIRQVVIRRRTERPVGVNLLWKQQAAARRGPN